MGRSCVPAGAKSLRPAGVVGNIGYVTVFAMCHQKIKPCAKVQFPPVAAPCPRYSDIYRNELFIPMFFLHRNVHAATPTRGTTHENIS